MIMDHLNTGLTGGAAIAASRLHEGLVGQGVTSRLWCNEPPKNEDSLSGVFSARQMRRFGWNGPYRWLKYKLAKKRVQSGRSPTLEKFSTPWGKAATPFDAMLMDGDVLHLHWVNSWLDWPTFFAALPNDLPTQTGK